MTRDLANSRLRTTIKALMKSRKVSYADLAAGLAVSMSTIKRLVNHDDLSMARLEQVAEFFDLDVFELIALAKESRIRGVLLSEEQEGYLATHKTAARYYWLLLNGAQPATIEQRLDLTPLAGRRQLEAFEAAGLIRRGPKGGVRLLHEWPLGFRFKGPLYKKYTAPIFASFMQRLLKKADRLTPEGLAASPPDFSIRILQFVLSQPAYDEFKADAADLIRKYLQESRRQLATDARLGDTVSFLIGFDRSDAIFDGFSDDDDVNGTVARE